MADFDEISRTLGRIEGTVKATSDQVMALFNKHDKLNEEVIEQRGAAKMLAIQFADHLTEDQATHKTVGEIKDDFAAVKNQGKGALFGIGLAGGSIGAGVATIISKMLGKG